MNQQQGKQQPTWQWGEGVQPNPAGVSSQMPASQRADAYTSVTEQARAAQQRVALEQAQQGAALAQAEVQRVQAENQRIAIEAESRRRAELAYEAQLAREQYAAELQREEYISSVKAAETAKLRAIASDGLKCAFLGGVAVAGILLISHVARGLRP